MGEARYYAKLFFSSVAEAEQAAPIVRRLFYEGIEAYEFWQDNRNKNSDNFWIVFEELFPLVTAYLKHNELFGKDEFNELAGALDFGLYEDVEGIEVSIYHPEISFSMVVWHFANWDLIKSYIEKTLRCKMEWISDEYINPMEWMSDYYGD